MQKDENAPLRDAVTEFHVRTRLDGEFALVEAVPKTGRFHQIRRHLLAAGHPIVGDYRYAGIERCNETGARLGIGTRMLLQAKSIQFEHPMTQDTTHIESETDPVLLRLL